MKTKEQIEQELVEAAQKKAEQEIALAKKRAEEIFEKQNEELKKRQEMESFLRSKFPNIVSRKWWTGVDDGIQTFFSKPIGTDTDGVDLRISFYLNLWISEGYCFIEQDNYSKERNRSCGYLGQLMYMCGDLQKTYDDGESEDGGSHKDTLVSEAVKAIPEMDMVYKECKQLLKQIKNWDDDRQELLEEVLEKTCGVDHYSKQKGAKK